MNETYNDFLHSKIEVAPVSGFQVPEAALNPALKPHQKDAVLWAHVELRGVLPEMAQIPGEGGRRK